MDSIDFRNIDMCRTYTKVLYQNKDGFVNLKK